MFAAAAREANPMPLQAHARSLPPSLVEAYVGSSSRSAGIGSDGESYGTESRAAMQAVVDALSVCSSEPAEPPLGSMMMPLMAHQKMALGWMLAREGARGSKKALCPNGGILADDQVGPYNL
jgi:hypothetical protein